MGNHVGAAEDDPRIVRQVAGCGASGTVSEASVAEWGAVAPVPWRLEVYATICMRFLLLGLELRNLLLQKLLGRP